MVKHPIYQGDKLNPLQETGAPDAPEAPPQDLLDYLIGAVDHASDAFSREPQQQGASLLDVGAAASYLATALPAQAVNAAYGAVAGIRSWMTQSTPEAAEVDRGMSMQFVSNAPGGQKRESGMGIPAA